MSAHKSALNIAKLPRTERDPRHLVLSDFDVTFLLSVGVACRRSWRDAQHDRLIVEHREKMRRIRDHHRKNYNVQSM